MKNTKGEMSVGLIIGLILVAILVVVLIVANRSKKDTLETNLSGDESVLLNEFDSGTPSGQVLDLGAGLDTSVSNNPTTPVLPQTGLAPDAE